jgi:hypothetical protein
MESMSPQATAWPSDLHEHATQLRKHLGETLQRMESAKGEPVPARFVKSLIQEMYALIRKVETAPDHIGALTPTQEDIKAAATTAQTTATGVQQTHGLGMLHLQQTKMSNKAVDLLGQLSTWLSTTAFTPHAEEFGILVHPELHEKTNPLLAELGLLKKVKPCITSLNFC